MEMIILLLLGLELLTAVATTTNVAVGKPVYVAGNTYNHRAIWAVDGSLDTAYCAYTDDWLHIDLKGTYTLSQVNITIDDNAEPMKDFYILLFAQNPFRCRYGPRQVCTAYSGSMVGAQTRAFPCDTPIVGRFLKISKLKPNSYGKLRLCEVQAFAEPTDVCQHTRSYRRITRMRLGPDYRVTDAVPVSDVLECSFKCSTTGACLAFNYNRNAKMCELILNPERCKKIFNMHWDYYGDDLC